MTIRIVYPLVFWAAVFIAWLAGIEGNVLASGLAFMAGVGAFILPIVFQRRK